MIPLLQYAWLLVRRHRQSRELRWVIGTLLMVIVSLTSMTLLSERLILGIQESSLSLLGADKVVFSNQIIPPTLIESAKALGLRTNLSISLITMLAHQDDLSLAEVKGVQAGYPLLGGLKISAPSGKAIMTHTLPAPGTVWIEERLLLDFQLAIGDWIPIGAHNFKISALLIAEPSKVLEATSYAPMVLMNQADLALTQLADPNSSHLTYSLLLAGDPKDFLRFDAWLQKNVRLTADQFYIKARSKSSFIQILLDDINLYARIFSRLNLCVAFMVIVIALKRFRISQLPTVAIFRCFGATGFWISACYACMLLLMTAITTSAGILLGILLEYGLEIRYFSGIISSLIPYGPTLAHAGSTAFLTAFFFMSVCGIPMIYHLCHIKPLYILDMLQSKDQSDWVTFFMACFIGAGMMLWMQPAHQQETIIFLGLLLAFSVLVFLALQLFLRGLEKLRCMGQIFGSVMHKMLRRAKELGLQIIAISLLIGLSLSLCMIKNKLGNPWETKIRSDAANYFLIGILPVNRQPLENFLEAHHRQKQAYYPLTVARLMTINQKSVSMDPTYTQGPVWPRALRISSMPFLKADNTLIAGEWFGPEDHNKAYASIESDFARYLGIKLGDTIEVEINQKIVPLWVKSIRLVDWNALEPNFLVIVPEGFLDADPETYMTSIYLPLKESTFLKQLIAAFPMISVIDIQMTVSQIYAFIQNILGLFQSLWLLNLGMSLVLSYFLIGCSSENRRQEYHMIHLLGASARTIFERRAIEYGLVSGLIFIIATSVGYSIAWVFS